MLDLRRLRLLSELARRGTIAEVARVVGYTPSAISQSLLQLEREAGVPLLERDGRRVRLTPAARGLVARTDRVLAELDAAEAELAADHGTVRGTVVIGAFPSAAAGLVAPAVADLCERHPELSCPVVEHEPEDGIPVLRSGELDVLVSESYEGVAAVPTGGLESHALLTEPLLLVLPREGAGAEPARGGAATGRPPGDAAAPRALDMPLRNPSRWTRWRTRRGSRGSPGPSSRPRSTGHAGRRGSRRGSCTVRTTRGWWRRSWSRALESG